MAGYYDIRRRELHNLLVEHEIDYDLIEIDWSDAEERERICMSYLEALTNCYYIFKILSSFDDIVTRFYFKNNKFYIYVK